jgi:hypothetical protein
MNNYFSLKSKKILKKILKNKTINFYYRFKINKKNKSLKGVSNAYNT